MRSDYNGVKYYSSNDLSLGVYFQKSIGILEEVDENEECTDINKIIELYNIYQIISSPGISKESSRKYLDKAQSLLKLVGRFFSNIDDGRVLEYYPNIWVNYLDDFWFLVDKFKVYMKISESTFNCLLNNSETSLYHILQNKGIVKHFDTNLAEFMRNSNQSARIIVGKFLEKHAHKAESNCFFPTSLSPREYEVILDKYVDSEDCNVGVLQLIESSQSSKECPISDVLRLKARRKAREFWKTREGNRMDFSYGISVAFGNVPEIITCQRISPSQFQISYDVDWIKNNTDYPTLLNNFIYLFGWVDQQYRCSLVSINSQLGVIEKSIGIKGIREYERGIAFQISDMKSLAELQGYSSILRELNIQIEDLIQWFFTDYLVDEFGIDGFVINMPSAGSTVLDRCRIIPSEMDGVLKQFRMFAKNLKIDRELLEMSSQHVQFSDLPSMLERKYAYINSSEIEREQHLLFSDQSLLRFVSQEIDAESFWKLIIKNKIRKSDFLEWEIPNLEWLQSRSVISLSGEGYITINTPRAHILKDLYEHEVICVSNYKSNDLIQQMVDLGDLRYENTLFSVPEQKYLNYVLNKAQYSNGLDLRNMYIHSTYPLDDKQHELDYLRLLRTFLIVVLKINQEFCLLYPAKRG